MKIDKNICIRIDRDELQILRGRNGIKYQNEFFQERAKIFNLLGNETRAKIIYLLLVETKLCVCDLSEILGMKIPAVSQHLRKLKDAGLLSNKREGTIIYYHIFQPKIDSLKLLLSQNLELSTF